MLMLNKDVVIGTNIYKVIKDLKRNRYKLKFVSDIFVNGFDESYSNRIEYNMFLLFDNLYEIQIVKKNKMEIKLCNEKRRLFDDAVKTTDKRIAFKKKFDAMSKEEQDECIEWNKERRRNKKLQSEQLLSYFFGNMMNSPYYSIMNDLKRIL